MSFSFTGPKGWVEQRWIVYALLRDNVQHYLEGGAPGGEFEALHSLAEALGGRRVVVSARKLYDELSRAKVLLDRPIDDLAISLRTRSIVSLHWPPPERRQTSLLKEEGVTVPLLGNLAEAKTLDDIFGHLVTSLLQITEGAAEEATVEVIDL